MKIAKDPHDELDEITIKICNLVRNMIYAGYKEQDFNKAIRNAEELLDITKKELDYYRESINNP